MKEKIFLHICCAPCSTEVIERLKKRFKIILFFSNSNIYPKQEYKKRLYDAKKISKIYGLKLIKDDYQHELWLKNIKKVKDYKKLKEGKERCKACFEFNLKRTAEKAQELKIKNFTTTLTVSPYKNFKIINSIGKDIGKKLGLNFIEENFKKQDGYKKSICLSKKHRLYRQHYCGCEFSLNNSMQSP